MQIDLVPELPPSAGYEKNVTAMDVFSRYLFAYPTSNQDAKTIAKLYLTPWLSTPSYQQQSSPKKAQPSCLM